MIIELKATFTVKTKGTEMNSERDQPVGIFVHSKSFVTSIRISYIKLTLLLYFCEGSFIFAFLNIHGYLNG